MIFGMWVLTGLLICIVFLFWLKIRLLQKAAVEIENGLSLILSTDTNTLLSISSRDIYMRKLTDSLNSQLRTLRRERLFFQQGNRAVQETITNVSHDLRTPLTAICGYLDLLRQENLPKEALRYLSIIENRTEALKQLTEEFFRCQRAGFTFTESSFENVSLNSALEEILSAHYAALKSNHITPKVSLPETKVKRHLNPGALSRILDNIISNAIKYSDGDLDITLTEIGEILFCNHAAHLDELQVMRLFDRFYTVETAIWSTGLGLSIAKELTEQMGGEITARYQNGVLSISLRFCH